MVSGNGNIPELARNRARAKRVECSWRESVFLPGTDYINGVAIKPMTLEHLTMLFGVRSAFLTGTACEPEHVGQFLWILSPQYSNTDTEARAAYLEALVAKYPGERFRTFYRAIHRYIWVRTFMDWPTKGPKDKPISSSMPASISHRIAATYGWSRAEIMQTPIVALFQFLNCISSDTKPDAPQFHPLQDMMTQRWWKKRRAQRGR